ncbi:MAG TPA: O-antigen ligase family protein [Candidatus Bathyarchaeia archaeon]|nr:O-antigen ligase family protein [Candidatus Bathyarchaeia archaeon]
MPARLTNRSAQWAYGGLTVAAALLFAATEVPGLRVLAVALAALPILAYLLTSPTHLLALLAVVSISLGNAVAASGIDVGVRVYGLDLMLAAGAVAAAAMAAAQPYRAMPGDAGTWRALSAVAGYGCVSLLIGFSAHHAVRDSLGDFRRMFCYPFVSFAIFRVYLRQHGDIRSLLWIVGLSGVALLAVFVGRVVSGTSYSEQSYSVAGEVVRYLSYSEAAGVSLIALTAVTGLFVTRARIRPWLLVALAVATVLVAASNYRTAWLALAAGLFAAGVIVARRQFTWALRLVGTGILVGAICLVLIRLSPLWPLLEQKFSPTNLLSTSSWRFFSWSKALAVWQRHPWLGVGLGYKHEFYRLGQGLEGLYLDKGNTIHNDLLWVLVNTGLVGSALLAWFFGTILLNAFRAVRRLRTLGDVVGPAVIATCVGQLVVVTVTATFEPTVSLGSNGVVLGLLAATLLEWGSGRRDRETLLAGAT